ncbi:hypothetical protein SEA_PERMAG_33 [Microbacterium phage PermaG]|nr:hypothetical protein SEA_PERMAG_33 [Microbacterium phage PermaG]
MRDGKPETPGEKFGYYFLGPLVVGVIIGCIPGVVIAWIWFGH